MSEQPSLNRLITRLSSLIGAATSALEQGQGTPDQWYDEVARQLRRYSLAANVSGSGGDAQRKVVDEYVKTQLDFLGAFRDEIKAAPEWAPAWNSRALMYAQSIKAPWWSGATRGYPLPAMPGDGTTQCLTHCGCAWDVQELQGEGNADAYWRRGKNDSCQTCLEREAQWAPLRIRGGELL